jgi:hypothetical protein
MRNVRLQQTSSLFVSAQTCGRGVDTRLKQPPENEARHMNSPLPTDLTFAVSPQ